MERKKVVTLPHSMISTFVDSRLHTAYSSIVCDITITITCIHWNLGLYFLFDFFYFKSNCILIFANSYQAPGTTDVVWAGVAEHSRQTGSKRKSAALKDVKAAASKPKWNTRDKRDGSKASRKQTNSKKPDAATWNCLFNSNSN